MRLISILFALIFVACDHAPKKVDQAVAPVPTFTARSNTKGLSLQHASERSQRVSDVQYNLKFAIGTDKEFTGATAIQFNLQHKSFPLTIDFQEGKIQSLTVNGAAEPVQYNGLFVTLSPTHLVEGQNTVEITYSHPYNKGGSGLYSFKDPEDGKYYLYTDFEPYDANLLFPSFDQPDLKATYTVTVEAPAEWTVITNIRETEISPATNGTKVWKFPKTSRFSTYLFSLHAGQYKIWESQAGKIPLRLFARQSLAKYVKPEEWFTLTKQGLAYFNDYFDYDYPFGKYDQLIVPDFNAGAMENVGAVTFSERYIKRGQATTEEREGLANTLLHEMAHMWFGDLVTMKWWNDLWLNESFATIMGYQAAQEATEFKKSWQSFYTGTKQWAYWEDSLVTTHPIEATVPDTTQAFANFDGITYGKGASVLRQIQFYMGADKFRNGVRKYFKKHEFRNATLTDFMAALEESSGLDLKSWTAEWLQTAGPNTLEARFHCTGDKISSFRLIQTAPAELPTLRSHRTQIALYGANGDKSVKEYKVVPVTYSGADTNVSALVGQACPLMVYPNFEDYDYVKVSLDPNTIQAVSTNIAKLDSPLARTMMWQALWDMVRDQQLNVVKYANLSLDSGGAEKDLKTLKFLLETIVGRWSGTSSVAYYLPETGEQRAKYLQRIESFMWSGIERAKPGTDEQKLWFDQYLKIAQTKTAQTNLLQMLEDKIQFSGLELDQDRRWSVIYTLSSLGVKNAPALIKAESKRDPSEKGTQAAMSSEAASPDLAAKKKWFGTVTEPKTNLSYARQRSVMWGLFPTRQSNLRFSFRDEFYDKLLKLAPVKENEFLSSYAESLAPTACTEASVNSLSQFLRKNASLSPVIAKELKVARQEDERCVKVRDFGKVGDRP